MTENTVTTLVVWYSRSSGREERHMFSIMVVVTICFICMMSGWVFSFFAGKLKGRSHRQEATPDARAYDPF